MTDGAGDVVAAADLKPTPPMLQIEANTASIPAVPAQAANGEQQEVTAPQPTGDQAIPQESTTPAPLSKSQAKKLRKKQEWEAKRDHRKERRRIKAKEKKERRRADPEAYSNWQQTKRSEAANATQMPVPVTIVYDCSYDELMNENEMVSLAAQLTRAYSDNRKAVWRPKMVVSSFGGRLKERFQTVLNRTNESWKGVEFLDGDFVEAARRAGELRGEIGQAWKGCEALAGKTAAVDGVVHADKREENAANGTTTLISNADPPQTSAADTISDIAPGETIYLSSDSPNTLTSLKPHSTYIIGALVDKNRHKGACYKAACSMSVKTAKLPIREFMQMSSRQVLATSHVGEIMLKWLEYGDWGRAFVEVIPTRKGGVLKENKKGKGKGGKDAKLNEANGKRRGVEDCVIGDDDGDEDEDDEEEEDEKEDGEDMLDGDGLEEDHGEGESKKRKPPEDTLSETAEIPPSKRVQS